MQQQRFSLVKSIVLIGLLLAMLFQPQYPVYSAGLDVQPITWDVIGLDSNNPSVGPNHFPVGMRVCNTSGEQANDVRASFVWETTSSPGAAWGVGRAWTKGRGGRSRTIRYAGRNVSHT